MASMLNLFVRYQTYCGLSESIRKRTTMASYASSRQMIHMRKPNCCCS